MKKKILSILCFITLACLSVFGLTACGEVDNEDKAVFTVENGVITGLTDYGKTLTEIVIPETINGVTITTIGDNAFSYMKNVTSIKMPSTITKINWYAFCGCSSLTNIEIPNGVTAIGDFAFSSCDSLDSIIVPPSVTSIGRCAFYDLKEITLPNTVTQFREIGFTDKLEKVNFMGTADEWAQSKWGAEMTYIFLPYAGYDLYFNGELATDVNLTTGIEPYAFYLCKSITSVRIDGNIERVGYSSFERCSNLTSVDICEGEPQTISENAFKMCHKLETVKIPTSVKWIEREAFSYFTSPVTINYEGSYSEWNEITLRNKWNFNSKKIEIIFKSGSSIFVSDNGWL